MGQLPEPERYRALAALLDDLAEHALSEQSSANEASDSAAKRLARMTEEKAVLDDELRAMKSELDHAQQQLKAERDQAASAKEQFGESRERLKGLQQRLEDVEAQLTQRDKRVYELENALELAQRQAQKAEIAASDTKRLDSSEEERRRLNNEIQRLQNEVNQVRIDKDAEIERLKVKTVGAQAATAAEADQLLIDLWDRLARAKPALAPGGKRPTVQAAERLFDSFVEMSHFIDQFETTMRTMIGSLARHSDVLARPWDAFAKSPPLQAVIQEIIDIETGKSPAVLKMRLTALKRWIMAALLGSDAAIESIGDMLEQALRGDAGIGKDTNLRVRDYLRQDGPMLFHQQMRALRSERLAQVYAKGSL